MSSVGGCLDQCVQNNCCQCWLNGCGLNGVFGTVADCLEFVTPAVEGIGNVIWIFASPLAFPLIFFFPSNPHTFESSGYEISMLGAPLKRPCACMLSTVCLPCGQWYVRRAVLGYDMTKYKLWQGYHDGPHCMARYCEGAPITIEAGTYGEQDCPHLFLCLEVSCLGCIFSSCCAFDVSRKYQRLERGLNVDPTEQRHRNCIDCCSQIMHQCFMIGCCLHISSYCVGLCAPNSEGAQECAGDGGRAARACCRIAQILWQGIMWTRVIGIGCMTAQMIHEAETPYDPTTQGPKAKPEFLIHKKDSHPNSTDHDEHQHNSKGQHGQPHKNKAQHGHHQQHAPRAQHITDRGMDLNTTITTPATQQQNENDPAKAIEIQEIKFPWEKK